MELCIGRLACDVLWEICHVTVTLRCMTWLFGVIQHAFACRDLLMRAWYWYACNWCSLQISQSHLRSRFLFLMSPLIWTRLNSTHHNTQVIRGIGKNCSIEPWLTSKVPTLNISLFFIYTKWNILSLGNLLCMNSSASVKQFPKYRDHTLKDNTAQIKTG